MRWEETGKISVNGNADVGMKSELELGTCSPLETQ